MVSWGTIHVFGYGKSQIIGGVNGKAMNSDLVTIAPLINYLATMQQEGTTISVDNLFALNVFNGFYVDFLPDNETQPFQRFNMVDLDQAYINALADDIASKI